MDTETDMVLRDSLGVEVQWLASERQVRLADDLRLGGVRVDERGDVRGSASQL